MSQPSCRCLTFANPCYSLSITQSASAGLGNHRWFWETQRSSSTPWRILLTTQGSQQRPNRDTGQIDASYKNGQPGYGLHWETFQSVCSPCPAVAGSRHHFPASREQTKLPKAYQPFPLREQVTRDNFSQVNPLVGLSKMATMLLAQEALSDRDQFQRKALAGALLGPVQLSAPSGALASTLAN